MEDTTRVQCGDWPEEKLIALTCNGERRHALDEHLGAVADLAGAFAEPFRGGEPVYWAGPWHDVGKNSTTASAAPKPPRARASALAIQSTEPAGTTHSQR